MNTRNSKISMTVMAAMLLMGLAGTTTSAWATPATATGRIVPHQPYRGAAPQITADNVVVTPAGTSATPQAAPAEPAPVLAVPAQPVPAPSQATVVESPRNNRVVHTDVEPSHNYMSTVALSALMGGVVGVLVGGSLYYLGDQTHARNIAYWGAGGVLLGVGVGVVQLAVQESRVSNATALNKLPSDPAPTLRLALFRTTF